MASNPGSILGRASSSISTGRRAESPALAAPRTAPGPGTVGGLPSPPSKYDDTPRQCVMAITLRPWAVLYHNDAYVPSLTPRLGWGIAAGGRRNPRLGCAVFNFGPEACAGT